MLNSAFLMSYLSILLYFHNTCAAPLLTWPNSSNCFKCFSFYIGPCVCKVVSRFSKALVTESFVKKFLKHLIRLECVTAIENLKEKKETFPNEVSKNLGRSFVTKQNKICS